MRKRPRKLREKFVHEGVDREERWRLIALAAKARRTEKLVFGAVLLTVVAITVYYTVSRRIVEDYRALLPAVGIPTMIMFGLYDPLKMLFLRLLRAFRSDPDGR